MQVTDNATSMPGFLLAMADAEGVTWSIATFGAIAEFSRAPGEAGQVVPEFGRENEVVGFTIVTPRGGLRYRHSPHAKIIAYEGLSKHSGLWSQGISVCLPERLARLATSYILGATGPDTEALHEPDRTRLLFNIGLGAPHIAACVRTTDPELVAALRSLTGQSLFEGNPDALHAVLIHSPDRVFTSALGRIEVATPIAHQDGETATGPHTHVLPDLLSTGRTHAATVPVPDGYLPCMNIFPPNPARDERGNARPFDKHDHKAFQDILTEHGDPAANAVKQQVASALAEGYGPDLIFPSGSRPPTRIERTALRVALRQWRHTSGPGPTLDEWLGAFEPNNSDHGTVDEQDA